MQPRPVAAEASGNAGAKHTPGPWVAFGGAVEGPVSVTVAFCGTSSVVGLDGSYCIGAGEAVANARLIAAAPRLLAALRELIEAGQFAVDSDDEVASMVRFGKATDVALCAIAEATGGSK